MSALPTSCGSNQKPGSISGSQGPHNPPGWGASTQRSMVRRHHSTGLATAPSQQCAVSWRRYNVMDTGQTRSGRGTMSSPHEVATLLFGRDKDLELLHAFVRQSSSDGGALMLSGAPGVGKTVLLEAVAPYSAMRVSACCVPLVRSSSPTPSPRSSPRRRKRPRRPEPAATRRAFIHQSARQSPPVLTDARPSSRDRCCSSPPPATARDQTPAPLRCGQAQHVCPLLRPEPGR